MTNILVPNCFVFAFSTPPFSVGETLHVAYKKYKMKRKFTFFGEYQYISSCDFKTSEFSTVFCTRENSDVFNTLDEIYCFLNQSKLDFLCFSH